MLNINLLSGLMSNPKNMKEACLYVEQARKNRGREHRRVHSHEVCGRLTDSEWLSVVTRQKKTFAKGKRFAHTARWNDHHEKWDLKTVKSKYNKL